jgi:hypothetical protein
VSCSTHQAAIYALTGKLGALRESLDCRVEFEGDVHNELHHGTNITGASLVALAEWVLQHVDRLVLVESTDAANGKDRMVPVREEHERRTVG